MGLEDVKKEILDNARKEAKQIISSAEKEKKEIEAAADSRVEEIKKTMDEEAKEQVEQYKIMSLAETQSLIKKERLAIEKAILDEVFNEVLMELETSKEREKHIKTLLKNTAKEGFSKIYCSSQDKKLLKNATENNIKGGLVLEDAKGEVRLDLSYETMLDSIKQESLTEIAKVLF